MKINPLLRLYQGLLPVLKELMKGNGLSIGLCVPIEHQIYYRHATLPRESMFSCIAQVIERFIASKCS